MNNIQNFSLFVCLFSDGSFAMLTHAPFSAALYVGYCNNDSQGGIIVAVTIL